MIVADGIETGVLYYWKRTPGWDWFGEQRWWEVFVEPLGFNGSGGLWLREHWRWNSGIETVNEQVKSLPYQASQKLIAELQERR